MTENYRRQTRAWRPNRIYSHIILKYIIPLKSSSQLTPIQIQQCLFDRDWALSSTLQCHYFWKHSDWKVSDWETFNQRVNYSAALKVACYQTTQVQTEDETTNWAFSKIKLCTLQNSYAYEEKYGSFLACQWLGGLWGKYCYLAFYKTIWTFHDRFWNTWVFLNLT